MNFPSRAIGIQMQPNNNLCVHCGDENASTKDHVPPRCLFPRPHPANLFTVPACDSCNKGASLDEEYFLAVLMLTEAGTTSAGQKIWEKLRRAYSRPRGLRARIASSITHAPTFSPGGIFLGHRLTVQHEDERFRQVVTKIVRGLYWMEYGERLPVDAVLRYRFLLGIDDGRIASKYVPLTKVGQRAWPNVFDYRHNRTASKSGSLWFLRFFEAACFWIVTS